MTLGGSILVLPVVLKVSHTWIGMSISKFRKFSFFPFIDVLCGGTLWDLQRFLQLTMLPRPFAYTSSSSLSMIYCFGLLLQTQSPCIFWSHFFILFSLSSFSVISIISLIWSSLLERLSVELLLDLYSFSSIVAWIFSGCLYHYWIPL
jgi:hypothetical protein